MTERIGPERFALWFDAGTRLILEPGRLRVEVPNRFFQDWIAVNFRQDLIEACRAVRGDCPTIEFRIVAPGVGGTGGQPAKPSHWPGASQSSRTTAAADKAAADKAAADKAAADSGAALTAAGSKRGGSNASQAAGDKVGEPGQPHRPAFGNLQSFIVGSSNRLAVASAELAVSQPGHISPLVICGPTSVGKTHLLQGIWTAVRKRHGQLRALYLAAEQFTTGFVAALQGSGLPSFRRKYRGVEFLILDDLHFFSGKRHTQIELLHTIDDLLRQGRQLVFAADRAPSDFADWAPELVTRLNAGMVCHLEPADYATRMGILEQMGRQLGVDAPQEVREFIASRLTTHARELSGALCRLKAASQAWGAPISLAMAQESLAEMIRHGSRVVQLHDIEKAVCDVLGVAAAELQSGCKAKDASYPRMLAMWLARKHTRAALSEIGEYFGRRSHSTVISAQRRVEGWMASGAPLKLTHSVWHVDEAIRLVEKRLMAS